MYKEIILSKVLDYIKLKKIPHKGTTANVSFHCPLCNAEGMTAVKLPSMAKTICHACHKSFTLIEIVRELEKLPDATEEEILTKLRSDLNLNVTTQKDAVDIDALLDKYITFKWALVPCAKNNKNPIQKEWQLKENRDKAEWFNWVNTGLNVGVRTGKVSGITVIDFDFYTKEEKILLVKEDTHHSTKKALQAKKVLPESVKKIMGETLIQETLGGFHVFYQTTDLPKGTATIEGIHVDIENEGGQVIVPPSPQVAVYEEYKDKPEDKEVKKRVVGYGHRKFINDNPIIVMPSALYDILKKTDVKAPIKAKDEQEHDEVAKAIADDNFKIIDLSSNRHMTLLKLGGMFQKKMNIRQVQDVLDTLNRHLLADPLPQAEITNIIENLDKYVDGSEVDTRKQILDYLNDTDVAMKSEIEFAVFGQRTTSEQKKRLDRLLANLLIEHKIIKQNARNYKIVKDMQWSDSILNMGSASGFHMPYFGDYAHFNKGDFVLIGAQTKVGKTTLAMNFVKRIVQQGIKPYYIYNESGGRFAKTAFTLGLKDGDFFRTHQTNPLEIILQPNKVYIYDWIRPVDFAKTADIFDSISNKLEQTNSVMIGFVQLTDKNEWFAPNLIRQFVAMSAKYNYRTKDGIETELEINDVRDRKISGKAYKIPCNYSEETKEVKTIEELDEEQRAKDQQEKKNDTTV